AALMMWTAWIAMLGISAITSAFLALLLVNGADTARDTARLALVQAERAAGVETDAVQTATAQLETWSNNAARAREDYSRAGARLAEAETAYTDWQRATMERFGQGSADGNRRLNNPNHYEHKPYLDAIASAKADLAAVRSDLSTADRKVDAWESQVGAAKATQREAFDRSSATAATDASPWDETMADMAAMMALFGLTFESGSQFKAAFAVFFALVLTLAPPFWSYQTGVSVAPEVGRQATRMAQIDQRADEARKNFRFRNGTTSEARAGLAPSSFAGTDETAAPMAKSETGSMGTMVDLAMGIADPDPVLPCGLTQTRFERVRALNYDKVLRLIEDAEGRLLAQTGVGALKKKYGGNDDVANMLKHVLFLEGFGEYAADGSITLFNPAEGTA
ncbi:MAG: hypothetical protein SV201_15695, partial [Pseudomonadota bacterium]|nr:hypothetical protein [Pseudomonadota bacterium]